MRDRTADNGDFVHIALGMIRRFAHGIWNSICLQGCSPVNVPQGSYHGYGKYPPTGFWFFSPSASSAKLGISISFPPLTLRQSAWDYTSTARKSGGFHPGNFGMSLRKTSLRPDETTRKGDGSPSGPLRTACKIPFKIDLDASAMPKYSANSLSVKHSSMLFLRVLDLEPLSPLRTCVGCLKPGFQASS